jgi:predicted nuclease of predicted toxin-antitoxin system
MNLPRELGRMLGSVGHEWRHVADIGMTRALDVDIVAEAKAHGECVVTHDLDDGQMVAFSGDTAPSVIIFRLRRNRTDRLFNRIASAWHEIVDGLENGAIVVIEEGATRIRRLPIEQQ